jgi:hypothetical protein
MASRVSCCGDAELLFENFSHCLNALNGNGDVLDALDLHMCIFRVLTWFDSQPYAANRMVARDRSSGKPRSILRPMSFDLASACKPVFEFHGPLLDRSGLVGRLDGAKPDGLGGSSGLLAMPQISSAT